MSTTPHDALFKKVFSRVEHAASALRTLLPTAIAARIDFSTLTLRPGSFVDQQLAASHSDLLFSASITGQPLLIYVLFEHQSASDPRMPYRLLRYMLRVWEAHLADHPDARRLPAILPVVLHHSETGWRGSVRFEEILDLDPDTLAALVEYVPRFQFVLEDLSFESDDALRARGMTPLGRLVLWCFRHSRQPHELVHRMAAWLELIQEVRRAPDGKAALALIWRYILTISDRRDPDELLRGLLAAAGPEAKEEIVSVADYLEEKGRLKGEQEGQLKGQRHMLLNLLGVRFGDLPESAVEKVQAADAQHLETWSIRVLTAPTLAEVLGDG